MSAFAEPDRGAQRGSLAGSRAAAFSAPVPLVEGRDFLAGALLAAELEGAARFGGIVYALQGNTGEKKKRCKMVATEYDDEEKD